MSSPWLVTPLLVFAARCVSLACHYLVPTPHGPRIEAPPALVATAFGLELGSLCLILVAFRLAAHALALWPWGPGAVLLAYAAASAVYLFVGQMDLELMRWLGQHVSWAWLSTYSWRPDPLKLRLFRADLGPTLLALSLASLPPGAVAARALADRRRTPAPRFLTTGGLAILALLGVQLAVSATRPHERWLRVRPPLYTALAELRDALGGAPPRERLVQGLGLLREVLGRRAEDYPVPGYPLWRQVADEERRLAEFRARPTSEKLDVLVLFVESPQGWELDLRRPESRRDLPNLVRLWEERGILFPYCHSGGYPSPEGRVGFHLGIWSHPSEPLLTHYHGLRMLSLPELLERAGYETLLVTAGDPEFDRMQPWFDRWYRRWEFRPDYADDENGARRFLELAGELPEDQPRFMNFATVTMHMPMTYPGCACPDDETFHQRYRNAARYMDRAVGRILDAFRASPRWEKTLVVVVGDHSMPPPGMAFQVWKAGTPNAAETWTFLLLAPPGRPGGEVRSEPVSHVDVAPTLLPLTGVQASHHFLGRDLLDPDEPAPEVLYSFRMRGVGITRGDVRLQGKLDDDGFLLKARYTDWDPACPDPEPVGCYRGGTPLPVTEADRAELARARAVAASYAELFRRDALMPAEASRRYPRGVR